MLEQLTLAANLGTLLEVQDPGPTEGPTASAERDMRGALHDVANALTVLVGWATEARGEHATPEVTSHALRVIDRCARAARDLARRAMGAAVSDPEVDALEIIRDVVDAHLIEAQRAQVRICLEGATTGRVRASSSLAHSLSNLLLNALAYSPANETIRVSVTQTSAHISVIVADGGPGVAEARRGTIFEGTSSRPGGMGLGLIQARTFAREARGDVKLLPPVDGSGARFLLTWSRSDLVAAEDSAPMSRARPQILADVRVLLLEDDASVAEFVMAALEARGAGVVHVADEVAMSSVILKEFDAALVDLSPLGGDAPRVVERLRADAPSLPLVIVSGSVSAQPMEGVRAFRWVRKPFEVAELVEALNDVLRRAVVEF